MSDMLIKGEMVTLNPLCKGDFPTNSVFEVIKVLVGNRQVNYRAKYTRTGRVVIGPRSSFIKTTDAPMAKAVVEFVPFLERLWVGQAVTVSGSGWNFSTTELYVVIGDKADDTYKIAKLGGDEGRYFNKIPRQMLTVVELGQTSGADDADTSR